MSVSTRYTERESVGVRLFTEGLCDTTCVLGENPIQIKDRKVKDTGGTVRKL